MSLRRGGQQPVARGNFAAAVVVVVVPMHSRRQPDVSCLGPKHRHTLIVWSIDGRACCRRSRTVSAAALVRETMTIDSFFYDIVGLYSTSLGRPCVGMCIQSVLHPRRESALENELEQLIVLNYCCLLRTKESS